MKTKTAAALGVKRLYHYQSLEKPERLARIFTDEALPFVGSCTVIGLTTLLYRKKSTSGESMRCVVTAAGSSG